MAPYAGDIDVSFISTTKGDLQGIEKVNIVLVFILFKNEYEDV